MKHSLGIRTRYRPARERGVVMFVAMILLLVLTLLGVALARVQTVEERLARNDANHQLALMSAEAALQAGFDGDTSGNYADFSGATAGLDSLADEINKALILAYPSSWGAPGSNSIAYNGAPLASAPSGAQMQFVIEQMPAVVPPGCQMGNAGNGNSAQVVVHRITAHALGGDGTASATVQTIRTGSC